MPPRTVKKFTGPGPRRVTKVIKKVQKPPETTEKERVPDVVVSIPVVQVKQEIQVVEVENDESVPKIEVNGDGQPKQDPIAVKQEDEVKESVDEYEQGERLDLEGNESEPEEYGGVDSDEKEIDQEDVPETDDVVEDEAEEGDDVEEEMIVEELEDGDMIGTEIEDIIEEMDGEEDEQTAADGEEHAPMVDEEEEERHEVVKERRKRKEFEIFVGGLDKAATEDDLKKVFSEVGEIVEVRLMMNPQTKKNKGFAFLRFSTVEQAKRAVSELKNPVVNGKPCGVSPSQDCDTLFLGNICKTWTKEALKEKLKHHGIEKIDEVTLVEDSNSEGTNRGFAFLEFSSRSDAMEAFKLLQKRGVMFGLDRPAKVSFADSFMDPGDEVMAQVKTVFIDGLPAVWDEDRVRGLLKKYGSLEKIELARNMPSARRQDFGFVTFDSHEAAVTCAKSINNADLGEGDSKAKVRARLSRPLQRGGKHPSRGNFRSGHVARRSIRGSWVRPVTHSLPRSLPSRGPREIRPRIPSSIDRGLRRPVAFRDRRLPIVMPIRDRQLASSSRSYERRIPVPSNSRNSMKDFSRRSELPPRSRSVSDYGSRVASERRPSYRDPYVPRGSAYSDLPRTMPRVPSRQSYIEDGYGQRFERPPPLGYREGRARDYDSISGSKRSYSALDDAPPRYADVGGRHSRPRYDYELSGSSGSHYGDAYSDRLARSNVGYGGSRSSIPSQETHDLYSSRQGLSYGKGSFSSGDGGGMYTSSFSNDYMSRGSDVGGSSYSSLYSRSLGGSNYMGSGGSASYY